MKYVAMQLSLTSLILLVCTPGQAFSNKGICERTRHDGSYTKHCCDFFEKTRNGCIACKSGFESFNGTPCVPCKTHTYGNKCWHLCSCMTSQRCDHVKGCLNLSTTVDEGLYKDITSTTMKQTVMKSFISTNDTKNGCTEIMETHQILVYVFGAGFFTTLIMLTAVIMIYRKKCQHHKSIEGRRVINAEHYSNEYDETEHYLKYL